MSPTDSESTHAQPSTEENVSPDRVSPEQVSAEGVSAERVSPEQVERARARAEAAAFREKNNADRAKARTLTNMFWAMLACLIVVAFLAIVNWRPKPDQVRAVEYTPQLADAKKVAPWVLGPEPMPAGWTVTSVEFRAPEQSPMTWHLGIVTDQKKYVGLEQSNVTGKNYQSDELGKTSDDGTSTVAGVVWQRKTLLDRQDEHALVLIGSGITTIVTGNAGYPALETFAATLH